MLLSRPTYTRYSFKYDGETDSRPRELSIRNFIV